MTALVPLKLEVATAGTVFDVLSGGSVTWVDISQSVLFSAGISASRGRRSESDSTSAGAMSFTLKSRNLGFGPSRVSLKVRQPVRLSWYDAVTYDELAALFGDYDDYAAAVATYESAGGTGTWRTLWTGSVSEVRQGWEGGVRGVQEVTCTDNVAVAERFVLRGWATSYALRIGNVRWLLPLDDRDLESPPEEASGAAFVPQLRPRAVGVPPEGASVALGQGSGPAAEGTVARFAGTDANGGFCLEANDVLGRIPSSLEATVSLFVRLESDTGRTMVAFSGTYDHYASGLRFDVGVDSEGRPYAGWTTIAGPTEFITATTALGTDRWHHIAVTVDEAGTAFFNVKLYVDGVEEDSYSGFDGPFIIGAYGFRIGASRINTAAWLGDIAHVGMFSRPLAGTEVAELAGVANGFVGESTLARFNRLQRLASFSTSTASGGQGTMGLQPIAGKSLAAAFGEIATVEHAPWYSTTDGTLALAERGDRYNRNAADVTLPGIVVNPGTAITVGDKDIANRITVSRPGGFTTTLSDLASIAEFGLYPRSVTFATGSDAEAETYAAALLTGTAQPDPETDSLTVDVSTVYRSITTTLTGGADIGSRVHVTDLPLDAYAAVNRFWVEGLADRFSITGWQRTYNVSPAAADTSVWVLGATADDELGTDTRLGL